MAIEIRPERPGDADAVWRILDAVVAAGGAFVNEPGSGRESVLASWHDPGIENFVAELDGEVAGAFYIKANGTGLASHVANASFAVDPAARGHGLGRAMGEAAVEQARQLGFRAMQFNAVVATNDVAIALWRSLGFAEVGRIPEAFRVGDDRFVDTLIMHRSL